MNYRIIGRPNFENDIFTIAVQDDATAITIPTTIGVEEIIAGSIAYVITTGNTYMLDFNGSWVKQPNA